LDLSNILLTKRLRKGTDMKMKIILVCLILTLTLSAACAETSGKSIIPISNYLNKLELILDPISDELDTNIPRISGKVSDPGANVYVNNNKALVFEDGTFLAYIEIPPKLPTNIEVKAESSGESTSKSFITTFYPEPFIWVSLIDTHSDPAIMEGWISYPDSEIEIKGNLINPIIEIQDNGFFTARFHLTDGYIQVGDENTRYDISVNAKTPGGAISGPSFAGVTMNSMPDHPFMLNDIPPLFNKVPIEKGKTIPAELKFQFNVPSPTTTSLELRPDSTQGSISEYLRVEVQPKSFLCYPGHFGTSRDATAIIQADQRVPPDSYFFRLLADGTWVTGLEIEVK
jgi:hypothetical protein